MNFLAHTYLSGSFSDIMVGNFIADAVKGNTIKQYSEEIIQGIMLHRKIDEYTDAHDVFRQVSNAIKPYFNRYSGVVVDIYFDHYLAVNWSMYSSTPLNRYVKKVYALMSKNFSILPVRIQRILPAMISQNWLENYAHFDDLQQVFNAMVKRANFTSNMEKGVEILKAYYADFQLSFNEFFPQIVDYIKEEQEKPVCVAEEWYF
ncbi:MAG: ACP phosphodiesterase [Hyphomicrobiales bacterium]